MVTTFSMFLKLRFGYKGFSNLGQTLEDFSQSSKILCARRLDIMEDFLEVLWLHGRLSRSLLTESPLSTDMSVLEDFLEIYMSDFFLFGNILVA